MPRFVILTHNFPNLHWDLMLENKATLRTWRLGREADALGPTPALGLPDHRLVYLDYEGPVGGDRGAVCRWDRGEYDLLDESDQRIAVQLRGSRICGQVLLERRENAAGWLYSFVPDASPSAGAREGLSAP